MKPTRFFIFYWCVLLVLTWVVYPSSYLNAYGVSAILIAAGAFTLGVILATAGDAPPVSRARSQAPLSTLRWLIVAGVTCNFTATLLAVRSRGFNVSDLVSFQGLLATANGVSISRYAGEASSPIIPPLLAIGFAAALSAPFIPTAARRRWWISAPVMSNLVYSMVTTERLGLLLSASLTAGGLIASAVYRNGAMPRLTLRMATGALLAMTLVASAFVAIAFLRVGAVNAQAAEIVLSKQRIYALGSFPAFSRWQEDYLTSERSKPLGLGTATFAGVEFLTGQERESTRAYGEFTIVDTEGRSTNVYTIFRGLILDFGLSGALLFLTAFGFVFGRTFRSTAAGTSPASAIILAAFYAVILLSPVMAVTSFTNVVAGILLAAFLAKRWPRTSRTRQVAPRA